MLEEGVPPSDEWSFAVSQFTRKRSEKAPQHTHRESEGKEAERSDKIVLERWVMFFVVAASYLKLAP